jgi:hypothetical protein
MQHLRHLRCARERGLSNARQETRCVVITGFSNAVDFPPHPDIVRRSPFHVVSVLPRSSIW